MFFLDLEFRGVLPGLFRFLIAFFVLQYLLCFPAVASEKVRIAAIFAKTGIAADHNRSLLKMTELAVQNVNQEGGVLGKEIELLVLDNESTPIGSALAAQRAVDLNVLAVIGGHWSSHSLAMAPILQEAAIPMITPASTNPAITLERDYIFRVCFLDSFQGEAMAHFAREDLAAQRAVVLRNIDEQYSLTLARYFTKSFTEAGGEIVADIQYRGDAIDFSNSIDEIQRLEPDVIYLPGYTQDSGLLIKQARKNGVTAVFLGGDAWDEIASLAGMSVDGSYQTAPWHPMLANEKSLMLQELYRHAFGTDIINYSSPLAYDAVMVLVAAMKQCRCFAKEKIKAALLAMESYDGATGIIRFDENGDQLNKDVLILQFKENVPVFVKSVAP
ncbi:MAG: ABC transporter substrate-binding protein [Desulfopila sp.]|jgi:branched-chain amino acid transport system substrate-binding protein|nr:ABC transporter substrate-binding protein [Desulfopila sp.]